MPPAVLAWLDYSEADQRRAREIVAMFSQRESRDELGLGRIRDALSDTLFPGTSVLLTRARYLLFARRPVRVGRLDRDHQAAHLLQLGGCSVGHRLPPELRSPAADPRGSQGVHEYARGPGGDLESPRLPGGG